MNSDANPLPTMPSGMGGGSEGGGGGNDRAEADAKTVSAAGGVGGGDANVDGRMQDCGTLPAGVQKDLEVMLEYRKNCPAAAGALNRYMAINAYKCPGTPTMYLFDPGGVCVKKMAVSYGAGVNRTTAETSCPQACSDNDKIHPDSGHYTPAGFHLTQTHHGADKYGPENSLALVGLEGQGSLGRGILIHESLNPGTASSWGCSGVGSDSYLYVLNKLGVGALVYNSFDKGQLAKACTSAKGFEHIASSCQRDGGGASAGGSGSSGEGSATK